MKILVDMNLSPEWATVIAARGWQLHTGQQWATLALWTEP
jgi:predicted nuclease of predicted toxin-antitoxin system